VPIKAKNEAEAKQKYVDSAEGHFATGRNTEDSNIARTRKMQSASVSSITTQSSYTASSEGSKLMRAVSPVDYSFIPADTSLLKNDGFCVLDQFIGIYGETIKHLTKDYFIDMCYKDLRCALPSLSGVRVPSGLLFFSFSFSLFSFTPVWVWSDDRRFIIL